MLSVCSFHYVDVGQHNIDDQNVARLDQSNHRVKNIYEKDNDEASIINLKYFISYKKSPTKYSK